LSQRRAEQTGEMLALSRVDHNGVAVGDDVDRSGLRVDGPNQRHA